MVAHVDRRGKSRQRLDRRGGRALHQRHLPNCGLNTAAATCGPVLLRLEHGDAALGRRLGAWARRITVFTNGFVMAKRDAETASGPDNDWLDMMVKKLITVLEAQLDAVASANPKGDAAGRAADARTLSALERTLERLSRLDHDRAAAREKKVTKSGASHGAAARTALERRLDKRLAALAKKKPARKS